MSKVKIIISVIFGIIIIAIAIGSTAVSTGLSIAYFQGLTDDEVMSAVVMGFVILLQSMVLIGSMSRGIVYTRTPQHYYTIVRFTNVCFVLSVLSTISFFNQFSKIERADVVRDLLYSIPFLELSKNDWIVTNLTNMTLIWISCIVLDAMSMYFPAIGSDLITGISTSIKIDIKEKGYLLKVLQLVTYFPKKWIDEKCIRYGIINTIHKQDNVYPTHKIDTKNVNTPDTKPDTLLEYVTLKRDTKNEDTIHPDTEIKHEYQDTVKEASKEKIAIHDTQDTIQKDTKGRISTPINERIERNDYIKKQIQMDTLQTKIDTSDTKHDTKQEKQNRHKQIQNPIQDTIQLISNVDDYIIKNYNVGEKINVSEVKSVFGFKKQDRKWNDKVRPQLKSCEKKLENNKLYRVKLQDIKLVK